MAHRTNICATQNAVLVKIQYMTVTSDISLMSYIFNEIHENRIDVSYNPYTYW
jgi:hypothetical protein